jgi:hypothetical protein
MRTTGQREFISKNENCCLNESQYKRVTVYFLSSSNNTYGHVFRTKLGVTSPHWAPYNTALDRAYFKCS